MQSLATPSQTPSPSVAPPTPISTGNNAERQADLGLTGPPPASGGTLEATLALLGDMASVVLDAMPLAVALRLCWKHRQEAWALGWMAERTAEELAGEGADIVDAALDLTWPVGLGMGMHLAGSGAVIIEGAVGFEAAVERRKEGFRLDVTGSLAALKSIGIGGMATDARGTASAGIEGGGEASVTAIGHAAWTLPPLPGLLPGAGLPAFLLAAARAQDVIATLMGAFEQRMREAAPDELRIEADAAAGVNLGTGVVAAAEDAKAEVSAGTAVGYDAHGAYQEFRLGAEMGAKTALFAGIPDQVSEAMGDYTVRHEWDPNPLVPSERFILTASDAEGGDSLVFPSLPALVAYLTGLGAKGGAPVDPIPEVSLRRSVEREIEPSPGEIPPWAAALADRFPNHGPVVGFTEGKVIAEVDVGPKAAEAALAGETLTAGPDGAEAAVLDVERAIAASMLGGEAEGSEGLDLEAGAAVAQLDHAARVATMQFAAGGGIKGEEAFVEEGASASMGFEVTERVELGREEARAALLEERAA